MSAGGGGDTRGSPGPHPSATAQARAALARGDWTDAVSILEEAVLTAPSDPSAWELLGTSCTWIQATDRAIEARERAYALYREAGDDLPSARVSLELANDYFEARGEHAVANGWFQRARRLLEGKPPCRERVLLGIWDAYMALMGEYEPREAAKHAAAAVALAQQAGAEDMEMLARALQGLARVTAGDVREGLSLLDESVAAVLGQEVTDPQWFYLTCCCMIDACDRVRDFGRSLEWCHRLREFALRWQVQAFLTTCRVKYTGALLWRGEWERCGQELEDAIRELERNRPTELPGARVRLAELRRRQGRREEAEALLAGARGHPMEPTVRAALLLDGGDAPGAAELLDGALRRLPDGARTERVSALELLVRARAEADDGEAARGATAAAEELADLAAVLGTRALRAAALAARGTAAAARSEHDVARRQMEDAIEIYEASNAPFETARARLMLARVLVALDRSDAAADQATMAAEAAEALSAPVEAARAREMLARVREGRAPLAGSRAPGSPAADDPSHATTAAVPPDGEAHPGPLTRRQRDVLALVARGMSNREIARALFLSEHTVHRHVANILRRLEASSRPAAVARAVREGIL